MIRVYLDITTTMNTNRWKVPTYTLSVNSHAQKQEPHVLHQEQENKGLDT